MTPLFEAVVAHVPAPATDRDVPFRMLISLLEADPFLGRLVSGRVAEELDMKAAEISDYPDWRQENDRLTAAGEASLAPTLGASSIRVIGGGPSRARVAASTSPRVAARAGIGKGDSTVDAG